MKIKLLFTLLFAALVSTAQVTVNNLRCEMLIDPLGIDVLQPRFSWQLKSELRNNRYTCIGSIGNVTG